MNDNVNTGENTTPDTILVPIGEWLFSDDYSYHRDLACVNHPENRFSTKNPWARSIFVVTHDCLCGMRDLAVVVPQQFSNVRGDAELAIAQNRDTDRWPFVDKSGLSN